MLALGVVNTGMKLMRELDSSIKSIVELGCGTSVMPPPKKLFRIAPGPAGWVYVLSAPVSDRFRAYAFISSPFSFQFRESRSRDGHINNSTE